MTSREDRKREVGHRAAELVRDGMRVGLGTGSTAKHLVDRLGERVADGLTILAVPTSERTAAQARELGIPLAELTDCPRLDIAIDGADEVDPSGHLIKGLGGALYREKLVAKASEIFVVIVDEGKLVDRLGVGCPVPVEVFPDRWREVEDYLRAMGADPVLRGGTENPDRTDNGNLILDAKFDRVEDPVDLEARLNRIDGVLENGLFPGMTDRVLVAEAGGVRDWAPTSAESPRTREL